MRLSPDMVRRFAEQLQESPREAWPDLIQSQARVWHYHVSTVRKRLADDAGLVLGESKTGERDSYVSEKDCRTIQATVGKTIRKGHAGLTLPQAIEVCWREGRLEAPRKPAVSTVRARLRELDINTEQLLRPAPHRPLISLYGNHMHQVDVSLCVQYEFGARGLKYRWVDPNKLDQYKDIKHGVHRYLLTDHLTGVYLPLYFDSPGERLEDLLKFLFWAWTPKSDERIPFFGLPEVLYVDRGPAFMSNAFQNLCTALDIKMLRHKPGNPRAKGSVESGHWHHERQFEAKLRLQPVTSIEELIEKATLDAIRVNAENPHSRHKRTRFEAWVEAVKRPLKVPVHDFEQFCWLAHGREEDRQVKGDLTVRWEGRRFLVTAQVGQKVKVKPHPFLKGMIRVFAHDGAELGVKQVDVDDWGRESHGIVVGTYEERPATAAEQILELSRKVEPFQHAFVRSEDLPKETYGWDVQLPSEVVRPAERAPVEPVDEQLSRLEAKLEVVKRLGHRLTPEQSQWWDARLAGGVTRSALDGLIEESQFPGDNAAVRVA